MVKSGVNYGYRDTKNFNDIDVAQVTFFYKILLTIQSLYYESHEWLTLWWDKSSKEGPK